MNLTDRWDLLYAEVNGYPTIGQAGLRDTEHPCTEFLPGTPAGRCQSDGHYLCGECEHREVGCTICGMHRVRCECQGCDLDHCWDVAVATRLDGLSLCADHAAMEFG